jgi:hypothetical protein
MWAGTYAILFSCFLGKGGKGHDIMMKGSIQQEDTTIVNIYALNGGMLKLIKQKIIRSKENEREREREREYI